MFLTDHWLQMSNPKVGAALQALREELESFSLAAVAAQVPIFLYIYICKI